MKISSALHGLPVLLAALLSCAGLPAGQRFEGTTAKKGLLSLQLAQEFSGSSFLLTHSLWPEAVLAGTYEKTETGLVLFLTALNWFHNWTEGWTEASFDIDGELFLRSEDGQGILLVKKFPEIVGVRSSAIRYKGDYVLPSEAAVQLSHRWERIRAVALWMGEVRPQEDDIRTPTLRSLLFPEVFGGTLDQGGRTVWGAGLAWHTDYTAAVFPAELRELRDSGTLWRDFEEGAPLWSLALQWKNFWERISETPVLHK